MDSYNFDPYPDPRIRILEKRDPDPTKKFQLFFLNKKYDAQNYDFFLLFISSLFIYMSQKSDLFLNII